MNKKMSDVNFEGIPDELMKRDQWVCWKYEDGSSDSKPVKSFFDAKTRGSGYDGIGFMLSVDDPFVAIEINDVINPEGVIEPWALDIIDRMNSYTEINPEGTGILIIIKGKKPAGAERKGGPCGRLEIYDSAHMMAITGNSWNAVPKILVNGNGKLQGFLEE